MSAHEADDVAGFSLPADPLATAVIRRAREHESPAVFNHSVRSFWFATLLAEREGLTAEADFDPSLLLASTVLHDLGTSSRAPARQRFEVEGADLAAELLTEHGVAAADVDRVWEAIALHTSAGIAERRGLLAYLTREGVGMDFGRHRETSDPHQQAIHRRWPRLHMATALVDAIVAHAGRAESIPLDYTLAGDLVRERRDTGTSGLERADALTVWPTD